MSITGTSKVFNVNENEYAYNIAAIKPVRSGESIAIYIPKLMGAINSVGPETIVIDKLFANAKECKPVFAKKISKGNAIAAILKENCNWLDKLNSRGIVPAGTQFTVEFVNGNIADAYVTTK